MHRFRSHYKTLLKKQKVNHIPKKFCAFIVSNPSNIERLQFYQKLSKYKKVDSFGKIFKNKNFKVIKEIQYLSNPKIYKNYKFVICFENSYADEYITEKLPNAMLGGAIPIYKGANNADHYFNNKSFINYNDYKSFDKMIEKIIELDKDDEKYLEFINREWITPQNKKNIEQKEKEFKEFLDKVFKE
ncbi:MAG: glycosyltransferase family 10 domain-containing protein [Candidatus Woesearchaeota archaeon]